MSAPYPNWIKLQKTNNIRIRNCLNSIFLRNPEFFSIDIWNSWAQANNRIWDLKNELIVVVNKDIILNFLEGKNLCKAKKATGKTAKVVESNFSE